ncbi:MAG: hypothetical protein M3O26_09920 [Pseudomonadota bacterium]|nr:hypothetical protein [Pseudomonadota bacterium]
MAFMVKHWSVSGSLFLFVRTYRQLEYYLKLKDARRAANQSGIGGATEVSIKSPNVIEIHPLARARFSHHPG